MALPAPVLRRFWHYLILGIAALLISCGQDTLLIGFSGHFSGRDSYMSVQARNGALLALEEINDSGVLGKKTLQLLVRDDGNSPEEAVSSDSDLANQGVLAIIGHMTSAKTLAVLPYLEQRQIPIISPTVSIPELEKPWTVLFKMNGPVTHGAQIGARYFAEERDAKKAVYLIDQDNEAYGRSFTDSFKQTFASLGGVNGVRLSFSSQENTNWDLIIPTLISENPDLIVLIASAPDTAQWMSVLKERTRGESAPQVLGSGWAYGDTLFLHGTNAVEGLYLVASISDAMVSEKGYAKFAAAYSKRFGTKASFFAAQGYDALAFIVAGLQESRKGSSRLLENLQKLERFYGARGEVRFDDAHDPLRPFYISQVQDGVLVTIKKGVSQTEELLGEGQNQ